MKTPRVIASVILLFLLILSAAQVRSARAQAKMEVALAREREVQVEQAREASGNGALTDGLHVLQADYKEAFGELLDVQLERKIDASRPTAERQGEALARQEAALAEKVGRLRAGIEAALPPAAPISNPSTSIHQ